MNHPDPPTVPVITFLAPTTMPTVARSKRTKKLALGGLEAAGAGAAAGGGASSSSTSTMPPLSSMNALTRYLRSLPLQEVGVLPVEVGVGATEVGVDPNPALALPQADAGNLPLPEADARHLALPQADMPVDQRPPLPASNPARKKNRIVEQVQHQHTLSCTTNTPSRIHPYRHAILPILPRHRFTLSLRWMVLRGTCCASTPVQQRPLPL